MKGLIFCGLVVLGASAQALVVDDFASGGFSSGVFSTGSVSSWVSAGSALGGSRYNSLNISLNPLLGDAKYRIIPSAGVLEVSSDADVDTNFTLGYGFASLSTIAGSNPLNQNFTSIPLVNLSFRTNDQVQPVTVTLFTNGGANSYSRTLNISGGLFFPTPANYLFDFTSDAASLGDVDGIKIDFDPVAGGDFSLNGVQVVPEPTSIAVLSIGAIALLRRRKK